MISPYLLLPIRDLSEACHEQGLDVAPSGCECPCCQLRDLCIGVARSQALATQTNGCSADSAVDA